MLRGCGAIQYFYPHLSIANMRRCRKSLSLEHVTTALCALTSFVCMYSHPVSCFPAKYGPKFCSSTNRRSFPRSAKHNDFRKNFKKELNWWEKHDRIVVTNRTGVVQKSVYKHYLYTTNERYVLEYNSFQTKRDHRKKIGALNWMLKEGLRILFGYSYPQKIV